MKSLAEKNALAAEAMPKVEKIIYRFASKLGREVDVDEIRSFALDGLAQAIENYDASKGVPIASFATRRVEGQITDGLSQNKQLPRRLLRQIAFIRRSSEMMRYEHQNPPPQDKVEAVHRLSDRLKDLAAIYITTCSVEDDANLETPDVTDSEYIVDRKNYYERLGAIIAALPPRQHTLVTRYFYEDNTMEEIAAEFGKSRSWVCRNLQTALKNMRSGFD